MLWFNSSEVDARKHPSTMFWKFGNKSKTFKGWDKEAMQKVEFDPVGKEYAIVWIGWCFSWFSTDSNRPIYSVEVPYDQLTLREIEVYTFDWDSKVVLYKGKYDKNSTKAMLKDKGANLFLNIHVVVWEGSDACIETLQVKGLNCGSIMDALRKGNYDEHKLKFKGTETKKYKVIEYEEIQCEEGKALTKKEKEDLNRLTEELARYFDAHAEGVAKGVQTNAVNNQNNQDTNFESRKDEFKKDDDWDIDDLPF